MGAGRFQLKRFGMGSQPVFFREALVGGCIHHRDSACFVFTVADVDAMLGGIVAQIVDIAVEVDLLNEIETRTVKYAQFTLATGDEEFLYVGRVDYALGIWNSGDATRTNAGANIDDLDAVVSQGGDEQLILAIESEMIEAALHTRRGNGLGQYKGPWLFGCWRRLRRGRRAKDSDQ